MFKKNQNLNQLNTKNMGVSGLGVSLCMRVLHPYTYTIRMSIHAHACTYTYNIYYTALLTRDGKCGTLDPFSFCLICFFPLKNILPPPPTHGNRSQRARSPVAVAGFPLLFAENV